MSGTQGKRIPWETVIHHVERLWCVEKVKLEDLPEIMALEYGFKACRRSYATKLKDMGWFRNRKRSQGELTPSASPAETISFSESSISASDNKIKGAHQGDSDNGNVSPDTTTPGSEFEGLGNFQRHWGEPEQTPPDSANTTNFPGDVFWQFQNSVVEDKSDFPPWYSIAGRDNELAQISPCATVYPCLWCPDCTMAWENGLPKFEDTFQELKTGHRIDVELANQFLWDNSMGV